MSKNKETTKVLDYLMKQNRPYSAVDVFNNLHKEIGKTALQKALDQLVETDDVKEKTYGKQKVYVVNQKVFPKVNDTDLKNLDAKITEISGKLQELQKSLRTSESELSSLNSSLTTEEIQRKIKELTDEIETKEKKLSNLKTNKNQVSPEEKDKIFKENEKITKEWRKRKRMALDIVDSILEGYPKRKKELFEEIGIETDEDVGVVFPK